MSLVSTLSHERKWPLGIQAATVFLCLFFFAKPLAVALWPQNHHVVDFHQEWLSAKNYWTGRPIYGSIAEALWVHDRRRPDLSQAVFDVNAHPPAAVLLALPFGLLDDSSAFLIWNLISLGALLVSLLLILIDLKISFSPELLTILVCGFLVSEPLHMHFVYGQINLLLLLLLSLGWWAERRQCFLLAGACLGVATALKLFPGFLVVYYLGRRQWRAVLAAVLGFLVVNLLTGLILGLDVFRGYWELGLPSVAQFRGAFGNASLPGLWIKLFAATGRHGPAAPLIDWPLLAWLLTVITWIALSGWVWYTARRANSEFARQQAFSLALTAMLLASPITWDHYFVLLLLPFLWLLFGCERGWVADIVFLGCLAVLWLAIQRLAAVIWPEAFDPLSATVGHTLWIHAWPSYALFSLSLLVVSAKPIRPGLPRLP